MDRLTREEIEYLRAELKWQVAGTHKPVPVIDIDALCDLALRALSQEAVRDEVLEELRRLVKLLADLAVTESEIEQEFAHGPRVIFEKGGQIAVRDVLMARKALKREPNAVAVATRTHQEVDGGACPAPAAPDVARFHGPQDPNFWAAVSDRRYSNEYIGIALRGWLDAQSPRDGASDD